MSQIEHANRFAELHRKGDPIILYNAWDAGSAKAIAAAGVSAIATSSWALAAAQGHADGEDLPLDLLVQTVSRIVGAVDLPVSADFEGGYSEDDEQLAANAARLLEVGVIGVNFEDRVVSGEGLYPIGRQAERIASIRRAAEERGVPFFINARTDLFLGRGGAPADEVAPAIERAQAYAAAGASGFFIPGLTDEALIARICDASPLPVNVMMMDGAPPIERLREIGVGRISFGATPYASAMEQLTASAATALPRSSATAA